MRIKHSSYTKYIDSLNKELIGKEIYSPLLLNNKTLLFPLAETPNKILVISLTPNCPVIYLTISDLFFSSLENSFLSLNSMYNVPLRVVLRSGRTKSWKTKVD